MEYDLIIGKVIHNYTLFLMYRQNWQDGSPLYSNRRYRGLFSFRDYSGFFYRLTESILDAFGGPYDRTVDDRTDRLSDGLGFGDCGTPGGRAAQHGDEQETAHHPESFIHVSWTDPFDQCFPRGLPAGRQGLCPVCGMLSSSTNRVVFLWFHRDPQTKLV